MLKRPFHAARGLERIKIKPTQMTSLDAMKQWLFSELFFGERVPHPFQAIPKSISTACIPNLYDWPLLKAFDHNWGFEHRLCVFRVYSMLKNLLTQVDTSIIHIEKNTTYPALSVDTVVPSINFSNKIKQQECEKQDTKVTKSNSDVLSKLARHFFFTF